MTFTYFKYWVWQWLRLKPHHIIPGGYLRRWHIIPRNRFFNIYLHRTEGKDWSYDLHDHPWTNLSIVLFGYMWEQQVVNWTPGMNVYAAPKEYRLMGSTWTVGAEYWYKWRRADEPHRLDTGDGVCWTLFLTGPKRRKWGFHAHDGWMRWEQYLVRHGVEDDIAGGYNDRI